MDATDCGVACLAAAYKLYGGYVPLERLREISGTSQQGTTLLGLRESARQLGFIAEGYQADIDALRKFEVPVILHTINSSQFHHYILVYEYDEIDGNFIVSDPAESSPRKLSEDSIRALWTSGALLKLEATDRIEQGSSVRKAKWQWVLDLAREDINLLVTAGLIGLIVAILGLSTAIFSQKLIDQIIPAGDNSLLLLGIGLLAILLLVRTGLAYTRQLFILRQGFSFNNRVMEFFLKRLLHLPKLFFDRRKTGDLTARMNDTRRLQRAISAIVSNAMIDLLLVIATTVGIFMYDWRLGLLALLWIPLFIFIVWFYHQPILDDQRLVMQSYARNESFFVDTILGIGPVKTYNKQSTFLRLGTSIYSDFQQQAFNLGITSIRFNSIAEIVGSLFIVSILGWSAFSVIGGLLTIGAMIAILQLVGLLMNSAQQLAIVNIQLQEGRVAFDRMYDFAALPPEHDGDLDKNTTKQNNFDQLVVSDLVFRYPGCSPLLTDIDLSVTTGEWIAILGESGCGKSTLLNILQRFYDFETGSVSVNGVSIKDYSIKDWRAMIGVVPQNIKIFSGTVLYNILLDTEIQSLEPLQEFLSRYGFDEVFKSLPAGVSTMVGEEGINLSGGQQQLLALARALYRKPKLLLLDEPTSALDRDTETFVLNLLDHLKRDGMGLIVLSHRLRTAKAADRIYIIENGSITGSGQHQSLIKHDNLYGRAWRDLIEN